VHGYLVDVLQQVPHRSGDALACGVSRGRAAGEIPLAALAPQLAEAGAKLRVGHDDEVPVLGVAGGRRLLRECEALLQQLTVDRARQVEAPANGARRREQLVRG
jgi:hypothetical protein